jgi:dsDNA-binding SOS-regulon protein
MESAGTRRGGGFENGPQARETAANAEKMLNRGNELKDLLKIQHLALFEAKNELKTNSFLRAKCLLNCKKDRTSRGEHLRDGQRAGDPQRRSRPAMLPVAVRGGGFEYGPQGRKTVGNAEKMLNRGNELKDLLKIQHLALFEAKNELKTNSFLRAKCLLNCKKRRHKPW